MSKRTDLQDRIDTLKKSQQDLEAELANLVVLRHGDFYLDGCVNHMVIDVHSHNSDGLTAVNPNNASKAFWLPEKKTGNIIDLMREAGEGGRLVALTAEDVETIKFDSYATIARLMVNKVS